MYVSGIICYVSCNSKGKMWLMPFQFYYVSCQSESWTKLSYELTCNRNENKLEMLSDVLLPLKIVSGWWWWSSCILFCRTFRSCCFHSAKVPYVFQRSSIHFSCILCPLLSDYTGKRSLVLVGCLQRQDMFLLGHQCFVPTFLQEVSLFQSHYFLLEGN